MAAVSVIENGEELFGFIDATGEWIIQPQFYRVDRFTEGLATVQFTPEWIDSHFVRRVEIGVIDRDGNIIVEPGRYTNIDSFRNGTASVVLTVREGGESFSRHFYGLINASGEELLPPIYDSVSNWGEFLQVYTNSQWGNRELELVIPFQFYNLNPFNFHEGLSAAQAIGRVFGVQRQSYR